MLLSMSCQAWPSQ
jgi:hypothetical protein